jgi:hypothetical protein
MGEYKLWRLECLLGRSYLSNKSGQIPQQAKYLIYYVNTTTGEICHSTDLAKRKYKRNKHADAFIQSYELSYSNKEISILSFVVNDSEYPSISKFFDMIGKKFKRKKIPKLGHFWVRDVGEIRFEKHYHILIAIPRIDAIMFRELFQGIKHDKYKVEFMKSKRGLRNYLKNKELFGAKGQRAYGRSKSFKKHINTR